MYKYAYRPTRFAQVVNRLFDDSIVNPQLSNPTVAALPLNVLASGEDYVISAAVPGLKAEDLHLEVLGDTVTLRGELPTPEVAETDQWLLRERRAGKFSRTLTLPTEVDGSQAEANVENGVLTVRLPKAEAAKPKAIKVQAK
jgi:HSP20 family protein